MTFTFNNSVKRPYYFSNGRCHRFWLPWCLINNYAGSIQGNKVKSAC